MACEQPSIRQAASSFLRRWALDPDPDFIFGDLQFGTGREAGAIALATSTPAGRLIDDERNRWP